ncbi:MAG: lytic transglycosylase domain-containing protein [Proteobacteria bacterium]|nr:lytic transglycosylase domain-containing protein [Pseudomonadota bacterium]MBU1581610.1 lytic transglycosylase domain-containing protein [Pseudomonadota bacterium]MBU2629841.1 lytic transglycosylase domain-containing protein [Pseudomonadota bacterium]
MFKKTIIILFFGLCIGCLDNPAVADIYTFIDSEGVVHFTNVPTSSDYKLYIRERPKKIKRWFSTQRYDDLIKKAQKKYGVEFSLIKAVIKVESGFNAKAVSKKGAKGLMQIMPDNFKSLLVNDPFNPLENIMGGTLYLQRLLKRYEYKLPLVLAAYNAGPEAVDRYNRIPPFSETQNFVRKVMETYSLYKNS